MHQSLPPVAGLCGLTWKPCRLDLQTKTAIIAPLPDRRPVSKCMMKCYRKQRHTYSVNYEQELPKNIYPKKNGSSLLLVIIGMHTTMSYYFRTCPTEWPKWNQMSPIKRSWTLRCSWWGRLMAVSANHVYVEFAETPFLGICAYNHQKISENYLLYYQWHPQIKRTTNLNLPLQ